MLKEGDQAPGFELIATDGSSVRLADLRGRKVVLQYQGIKRNTFLIDEEGKIARVWESVKPDGHAEEVLAAL
ncbi:MAG: hypothetical protein M3010_08375 [Candidatus Dormibacteraeota bacterium]|nr:hypothetical protein [Candidatus Dormibacteraeota bacterium]